MASHYQPRPGCCSCIHSPSRKVAPMPGIYNGYAIVEIRPNRFLRITHIESESSHLHSRPSEAIPAATNKEVLRSGSPSSSPHHAVRKDSLHVLDSPSLQHSSGVMSNGAVAAPDKDLSDTITRISKTQLPGCPSQRLVKQYQISGGSRGACTDTLEHKSLPTSMSGKQAVTNMSVNSHVEGSTNIAFANDQDTEVHSISADILGDCDVHDTLLQTVSSPSSPHQGPSGATGYSDNLPVIFLIHGVGGSTDVWRVQIDYFSAKGYEIVAYDFIGHGLSCAPKESTAYDFSEIMQDTLAVFDKYSKVHNTVIGHSYGSAFHDAEKSYMLQERAFDIPTYVLKHTMNGQNWMEGNDDYHKTILAPTLLIHGSGDQLITVDEEQEMQEAIEDCELVIVDQASHMVMLEKPHVVNHLVEEFILAPSVSVTVSGRGSRSRQANRRQDPLYQSVASLRSVKSIPSNLLANSLK